MGDSLQELVQWGVVPYCKSARTHAPHPLNLVPYQPDVVLPDHETYSSYFSQGMNFPFPERGAVHQANINARGFQGTPFSRAAANAATSGFQVRVRGLWVPWVACFVIDEAVTL